MKHGGRDQHTECVGCAWFKAVLKVPLNAVDCGMFLKQYRVTYVLEIPSV